jgi:hypothetical protein
VKQAMKDCATVRAIQNSPPSGEGDRVAVEGITLSGDIFGFGVLSGVWVTPPSRKGAPPPLEGED